MKLTFVKMHGLGNDFVVLDGRKSLPPLTKKILRLFGNRRFGVGCDQILVLRNSRRADFRMQIFNADGSEVEMCGNGIRCLTQYVLERGFTSKKEIRIETPAGIQKVTRLPHRKYRVDMGEPILKGKEIPVRLAGRIINRPLRIEGKEFRMTCLSMGNPHCVIFLDDLKEFAVDRYGPLIENHTFFPKRTNVEFVKVLSRTEMTMRVWERGAGETLACGSGACAVAVAGFLNNLTGREVKIQLRGGILEIEWSRADNHIYMTGPATEVFKGEIDF